MVAATGWSRPYILGETEVPEVPVVIPEDTGTDPGSSSGDGDNGSSGGGAANTENAEGTGDTINGAVGDSTTGGDGVTVDGNRADGRITGATPTELETARGSIVLTNPDNGVLLLSDGTLFDPAFYAATNADVVDQYGTDTVSLAAHYIFHGKEEGRPPIAPIAITAKAEDITPHFDPNADGGSSSSSSDDDDDDDDDDDSSSSSSSGGSSGGNSSGGGNYNLDGDNKTEITDANGNSATVQVSGSQLYILEAHGGTNIDLGSGLTFTDQGGNTTTVSRLSDIAWGSSADGVSVTDGNGNKVTITEGTTGSAGKQYTLQKADGTTNTYTDEAALKAALDSL